ncbi:MAG: winged helix-turn-helix domain-containing protein [Candidatus Methanomethylicaceae archaeon]
MSKSDKDPESMEIPAKIKLMYYLWKKKGHRGSKTELAKELGYADETTVLKHLRFLENMGYVREEVDEKKREIRLTKKGEQKIWYFTFSKLTIFSLIIFALNNLIQGILYYIEIKPSPTGYLVSALGLFILSILIYLDIGKRERELLKLKS